MKTHVIVLLAMGALAAIILLSCSDDDCPICPTVDEEPEIGYNIYLACSAYYPIYVFNTKEMAIVDSIMLDTAGTIYDIAVSADEKYLMYSILHGPYEYIVVRDIETRDTVRIFRGGKYFETSNTGKYIVLSGYAPTVFLDGFTLEPLFEDYVLTWSGGFTHDDGKCYLAINDTLRARVYDMNAQTMERELYLGEEVGAIGMSDLCPNASGDKLYFTNGDYYPFSIDSGNYITAYDFSLDSITLRYGIGPPATNDIKLSPDGKYIVCTDPGFLMLSYFGSNDIIVLDQATSEVVAQIPAGKQISGNPPRGIAPGAIEFTPDSKYAIIVCAEGCGTFLLLNMQTFTVDYVGDFRAEDKHVRFAVCPQQPITH